ncbi:AAA family ATPase [Schaalia dentiphila]|uniref:AAA family ATPase n=1 Tax=Schaalia dentiphila TaxID=3050224 RepID=UPI0028526882|nr:AAA family ATPase [Schaalia sp. C24]
MNSKKLLVEATVDGLFGKYNHSVSIEDESRFVILYGRNGVGKTKLLEIIHHLSRLDYARLSQISFSIATLRYSDGSTLTALREPTDTNDPDSLTGHDQIMFRLNMPDTEQLEWTPELSEFHEFLFHNTSYIPIGTDLWEDTLDGEIVSFSELTRRYDVPYVRMGQPNVEIPVKFREFCYDTPTYFINTQRLSAIQAFTERAKSPLRFDSERKRHTATRIRELSENIKEQLNKAQTEHSRLSQQKDRSFPSRVLQAVASGAPRNSKEIQIRYAEQNEFRDRLAKIVSVELPEELGPSSNVSKDWELALFDLYVRDANEKLEPFRSLLKRIELLQNVINTRLENKVLSITDTKGLIVRRIDDGEIIDLDSLSSGEQHEIILLFDLLFNVEPGATVLIDEPEISLHIEWQIKFIPDVMKIAEDANFRFIVATHSPQIINGMWSKTVRLATSKEASA